MHTEHVIPSMARSRHNLIAANTNVKFSEKISAGAKPKVLQLNRKGASGWPCHSLIFHRHTLFHLSF